MTTLVRCPVCYLGFRSENPDHPRRIAGNDACPVAECPASAGQVGEPGYLMFCASCRREFKVPAKDIPDGEAWYCDECVPVS